MKMLWFCLLLGLARSQTANVTEKVGNIIGSPCTDKNHLFLAPGVLTAGSMNRACVSRFYTDGPARLFLSLLTEDRQTVTASRELPPGDGGCLDINVPSLPNSKADLIVSIRYPEAQCVWERRIQVRISSGRVVVLSTERARYRPGELLRLRVLAVRQDLSPSHGVIKEIWLEGPSGAWEGSRVTQWQNVRTRLGLAQLQYQLDELAPVGKWTVRAKLGDGSQGSAVFWVVHYELPPFQLSVRHAPRVLRTSERLVWTVCVRYPWSEAVEGMLVIRLRGAGGGSGGIRTAVQLTAPKACHRHAAAAKRIGLGGSDPPDVVVADFSFQEEGTRIWQNTTVVSQVVDQAISLEFLTKHRAVISPGLPYKLKVKATRWDDKPASNELVKVCRYPSSSLADVTQETLMSREQKCAEGTTDASGIARVLFAAGDDAEPFYRFEAQLSNDTTISAIPLTLPVRHSSSVHAALGPLKVESRNARTFVPLYLNTNKTSTPFTVHFVVITRGGILYRWGATTQCPISTSADQIHTTPRNSKCKVNFAERGVIMAQLNPTGANSPMSKRYQRDTSSISTDVSDALLDRHQLRVMLPIKVSHQMCPDSHLIAYFYHEGELISASKHFEMDECFVNKVEATWLTRQAQPGSIVSLQISTPGPALCALTVLDAAAKWIQPQKSVKEQLMEGLRRVIDSHRNLTEYDAAGACFLDTDTPEIPSSSIELTASWMAAAGVRLLGGDVSGSKNCISRPPALLVADENVIPRSDFSEAWLWRLLGIGNNGTGIASARAPDSITRFEASAICVTRNGVAISTPTVLQVFREFFIHADSPKRLRRGDSTIIRYRIFNYLYEPLSVQIQILTDPHVEGPKEVVEAACVQARSSIARRAEIRARAAAPARVIIRAKAVSDGNCGNITSGKTGVSDEVIIRISVDPEGVPVQEQKSILLCGNNSKDSSTSKALWNWPPVKAVPGTETLTVWVAGDVTGPLLADADSLIQVPRGCGEQNMAQLATNLLALQQLDPTTIAAFTAKELVSRGFTRQLQYVHPSGGFSAFGPSDATSSTWLTAFVVRHLRKAHNLLWPNLQVPPAIIRAERWLLNQQMENGCFRNEGHVFHRELRGGLNDEGEIASVALTAYVIASLIESTSPLPYSVIRNTLSCLRAFPPLKSKTPTRVYAHALLAYAYMKLTDYEEELRSSNEASLRRVEMLEKDEGVRHVLELLKMARRSGDFVWWEASSLATSIEATSYALQALQAAPAALVARARPDAPAAARWLSAHRTSSGGFVSTQDTLVALEALTAWSSQAIDTNLTVTAHCSKLDHRVTLLPGMKIPEIMKIRPGEELAVSVEGKGCALVQATRAYNVLSTDNTQRDKQLSVQVTVHTDGPYDCDNNGTYCFCAAIIEACVMWIGRFPEMALLEVTLPGGFGADAQLLYSQLHKPSTLLRRIELTPTSSRAAFYLGTRDGSDTSGHIGHQCYNIHATGPRVKTKPAYAKVQDYYAPSINDTQVYTIPEECPSRIVHESNEYRSSDNLYNKARATDNDAIVITNEFSFDDIPDGIPLEDPLMYDHMIENDNYKIATESHQDMRRLEEPKDVIKTYSNDVHNSSENFVPENVIALENIQQDHSQFDNIVTGDFSVNEDAADFGNFDYIVNKGIDKDGHFGSVTDSNVAVGYAGSNEATVTKFNNSAKAVGENDLPSHDLIDAHNFDRIENNNVNFNEGSEKDQNNYVLDIVGTLTNDDTDNHSNFDKTDVGSIRIPDGKDNNQNNWDNGVNESIKTKGNMGVVHSHSANVSAGRVINHNNFNNIADVNVSAYENAIEDNINRNNAGLQIRINGSLIHDYGNFNYVIDANGQVTEATIKDNYNNIAVYNTMTADNTEIDQHRSEIIEGENTTSGTKIKVQTVKNNKDKSQHETLKNLVKEIDSLNLVAHKQLNETQTRYNVHQFEYTHADEDKALNINNNQNSVQIAYNQHNYNDDTTREPVERRSFNENIALKPQVSEQVVSKFETDLNSENNKGVDNPLLAEFHVIDSEKDLEVPTGIEGPVPAKVLPPADFNPPTSGFSRRLQFNHRAFEGPVADVVLPPPTFFPSPMLSGQSRMQTIPSDINISYEGKRQRVFEHPPSINFALATPPQGYPNFHNDYPPYLPPNINRPIAALLLPQNIAPTENIRSLKSVYTPNGPYFYFKTDNNALKKFFAPLR